MSISTTDREFCSMHGSWSPRADFERKGKLYKTCNKCSEKKRGIYHKQKASHVEDPTTGLEVRQRHEPIEPIDYDAATLYPSTKRKRSVESISGSCSTHHKTRKSHQNHSTSHDSPDVIRADLGIRLPLTASESMGAQFHFYKAPDLTHDIDDKRFVECIVRGERGMSDVDFCHTLATASAPTKLYTFDQSHSKMSSFLLKSTEMHNHPMGPCADTLGLEVMADLVESSPPDGPEKTLPLSADNDCVTALLAGATNSVEEDTSLACTSAGLPTDMALSAYNTTIELRHNSTQRSEDQTDSTDTSSIRTGLPSLCSLSTSSEDAISEESLVSVDDGTATQSPADNAFVNKEDAGSVMIASAGATLDNVLSVPAEAVDVRSAAQTPHGPMDAIDALSIRTDRLSLSSCLAPSSRRTLGSSTRSIISQWSATMAGPMATDVDVELLNARGGIMTELRQRMSKLGPLLNTKRRLRDEMLACILDGRASKLGDILATGRYSVHDPVSMELRERYLGAQTALELASWLGNPEVHSLLETCGYVDGATLRHVREFPIAAIIPAQKLREDMFVCVQESKVDRLADILALNKCNLNGPLNEHLQQEYGSSWTALDLALLLGDPAVVGLIVHGGYNGNVSPHALQRIVEFTEASRTEMQHLYRQKLRGEMFACVVGERTARLEEILATGECDVNSSLSDDLQRSYPGAHTVLDIAIYLGNSAAAGALMARDELSVLCLERAGLLRESRLEDSVITCHLHMLECLFHANFEKLGISERGRLALFTSALTHHSTTVSKLLRQHLRPKPIATEASHRLFATKLKDAYLQKDALRLEALITLSDATDWWRWTAVTNMLTELFRYKNLPFDGFYNITAILRHDPTIRRRMSDILTAQLRRHMASNDAAAVTYTFAISDAIEWDDVTPANCALVEEIFAAQTKVTSALRLPHARSHDAGRAWGHLTDHKRREIRTTYSLAWKQFGMMYVLQHVSETDPSHSLFDLGVEMAIASADMVLARSIPRQHKEDAVIGPRLRDVFMEAMAKHVGQANREQLRHLMKVGDIMREELVSVDHSPVESQTVRASLLHEIEAAAECDRERVTVLASLARLDGLLPTWGPDTLQVLVAVTAGLPLTVWRTLGAALSNGDCCTMLLSRAARFASRIEAHRQVLDKLLLALTLAIYNCTGFELLVSLTSSQHCTLPSLSLLTPEIRDCFTLVDRRYLCFSAEDLLHTLIIFVSTLHEFAILELLQTIRLPVRFGHSVFEVPGKQLDCLRMHLETECDEILRYDQSMHFKALADWIWSERNE